VGPSVRLIGDDQQLAAIGAGGVLRDIKHVHGALQLTELHRFTDPAEAEASLTLRDGDRNALTFYLDQGRVHVGDLARTTEDAFKAWVSDRKAGLDAIMLAPTRDLVTDLNRLAREQRIRHTHPDREVQLADGNQASVGDVIITRTNDRRLRASPTDFVRNGDRWTVTKISTRGDITVRHLRSQLICRLPADYVRTSIGLGYARAGSWSYRFVVLDDRAGLARFRGKQHVSRFSDRRCHGPALATKHCLQFARQLKIRRRTGQIDERLRVSIPARRPHPCHGPVTVPTKVAVIA